MRRVKHIHFVGIGGAGMGGIAEVLFNQGYKVTGSDLVKNTMTERLAGLGIDIIYGHKAGNLNGADVVVITSALSKDNPEWLEALCRGIPVVRRAEMLAELMRFGQGIAVAGTHGKTTTTSILSSIMATANLDPTFVIGGKLNSIGTNAKLGAGSYFIAEADESDASFLHLNPVIAIVTNIDRDHMATYGGDFQNLTKTFVNFLLRLPFYGMAVINIDDPVARNVIPELRCQVVTYGCAANADYQLLNYKQKGKLGVFEVYQKSTDSKLEFTINLPGMHNALNALASIAVCLEENIELKYIKQALLEFKGISRRFHVYENLKLDNGTEFTLIDDYGHHPKELSAMISAIKQGWPGRRIVMLFQPHRYTRTRDLFNEFVDVLSEVDVVGLLPVYAASELPLPSATSNELYKAILVKQGEAINQTCLLFSNFEQVINELENILSKDDIVVVQGAGDVSQIAIKLLEKNNIDHIGA